MCFLTDWNKRYREKQFPCMQIVRGSYRQGNGCIMARYLSSFCYVTIVLSGLRRILRNHAIVYGSFLTNYSVTMYQWTNDVIIMAESCHKSEYNDFLGAAMPKTSKHGFNSKVASSFCCILYALKSSSRYNALFK